MNMELVKLSEIKPNSANPRVIKDDRFSKLVNSIIAFPGMLKLRPIVVNDKMICLGGNMRLRAMEHIAKMPIHEIGERLADKEPERYDALIEYWEAWKEKPTAPIIKASELSEDEQKEFIIKDNVGFGEWDMDILANEWDMNDLDDWGFVASGFPSGNVDLGDFFNTPDEDSGGKGKPHICPHCGKDTNKTPEDYESDGDNT